MATMRLKGRVTLDGNIEVQVPLDFPAGDVIVTIESLAPLDDESIVWDFLSDETLAALMTPEPKSGAEIIALGHTGGWEDRGITDSVSWLEEQRRIRHIG
jgi:hypothetical protein